MVAAASPRAGAAASPLTDKLKVTAMELELTAKSATSPTEFTGAFVINFDNTQLVRPIQPARVPAE